MDDLTFKTSATTRLAFERVDTSEAQRAVTGVDEWAAFVREGFASLYNPADVEGAPLLPTAPAWAQRANRMVADAPELPELRTMCAGSRTLAAECVAGITKGVAEIVGSFPKGPPSRREDDIKGDVEALAELAQQSGDERMAQSARAAGKVWAQSRSRRQVLDTKLSNSEAQERINAAIAKAKGTLSDMREAMEVAVSFGLAGSVGQLEESPEGLELAKSIASDELLRKVLSMLGALKEKCDGKLDTVPGAGNLDLVGIGHGDDIGALVDDEMSDLICGDEYGVLERVSERRAMVWERRNEDKTAEGDFTVLLDCSASMGWGHNTSIMARATALGLALGALRERRRVVFVTFATDVLDTVVVDPGSAAALTMMLKAASRAPGGGTNVEEALVCASLQRKQDGKRADCVVVTDGEWEASRETAALCTNAGDFVEARIGQSSAAAVLREHPWMSAAFVVNSLDDATRVIDFRKRDRHVVTDAPESFDDLPF